MLNYMRVATVDAFERSLVFGHLKPSIHRAMALHACSQLLNVGVYTFPIASTP